MIFIIFIPVIIALVYVLNKKTGLYVSTLVCCVGCTAGVGLYMLMTYAATGTDFISYFSSYVGKVLSQNSDMTKFMYAYMYGISDYATVSLSAAISALQIYMAQALISFLAGFCSLGGLVIYLCVWGLAKAFGASVVRIPAFSDFYLPRHFGRWSALCYVLVLIGYLAGWNNFDVVYSATASFLGCIYFVQGLCFMEFVLKSKIKAPFLRIIIMAAIAFLFYQFFVFTGVFEQLFKMRRMINRRRQEGA